MVDHPPRMIDVDDLRVSFAVAGSATAPPLLLLHGFPLDRRMWAPAMSLLADTFQVCAVDLPGFGDSELIAETQAMGMLADWLERFIDAAQIARPIVLCGLSMGGYIALEFAARHADALSHLVLCDTKTEADSEEARAGRLKLADSVAESGMDPIAESMMPKLVAPPMLDDERLVDVVRRMVLDCDPAAVASVSRGMAARRDTTEVVKTFRRPLLSIVGESDNLTPPELMRGFTEQADQGQMVMIRKAGHLSPLEQPQQFAKAVIAFYSTS